MVRIFLTSFRMNKHRAGKRKIRDAVEWIVSYINPLLFALAKCLQTAPARSISGSDRRPSGQVSEWRDHCFSNRIRCRDAYWNYPVFDYIIHMILLLNDLFGVILLST